MAEYTLYTFALIDARGKEVLCGCCGADLASHDNNVETRALRNPDGSDPLLLARTEGLTGSGPAWSAGVLTDFDSLQRQDTRLVPVTDGHRYGFCRHCKYPLVQREA